MEIYKRLEFIIKKYNNSKDSQFKNLRFSGSDYVYMVSGEFKKKLQKNKTTRSLIIFYQPKNKTYILYPSKRKFRSFNKLEQRIIDFITGD